MVTDEQLEKHVDKLIADYFRDIPKKVTPQLYLLKMYQVFSSLLLLDKYYKFKDNINSEDYDTKFSVKRWYSIMEYQTEGVIKTYLSIYNQLLSSEKMSEVFEINSLMSLLQWIAFIEASHHA